MEALNSWLSNKVIRCELDLLMHAASQLPGRGPSAVIDAVHLHVKQKSDLMRKNKTKQKPTTTSEQLYTSVLLYSMYCLYLHGLFWLHKVLYKNVCVFGYSGMCYMSGSYLLKKIPENCKSHIPD